MLATREYHQEFYATAAQVIPLLLFAVALELRILTRNRLPRVGWRRYTWLFVVGMTIGTGATGEIQAFRVMNSGTASEQQWASVANGLFVPGAVVLLGLIARIVLHGRGEERERIGLATLVIFVTVASIAGTVYLPQPF